MSEKESNPKDIIGTDKLPLHLWPETATIYGCLALLDGTLKYGRANWRVAGVKASIYVDACKRHLNSWFEGEDLDQDSALPHLAHALACLAILVDSHAAGKLTDDRQYPGGYQSALDNATPFVKALREKHKDKDPTHYTRKNSLTFHGVTTPLEEYEPLKLDNFPHIDIRRAIKHDDGMVHSNPIYYWLKYLKRRKERKDNND